jgi:lysophospholipase
MRRVLALLLLLCLAACKKPRGDPAPDLQTRLPPGVESRFWAPPGWAWGALKIGDRPFVRYGVSPAPAIPLANVIILTGYGESAEQWFETARELNDADYTVWILESAGQGGSARYASPADLGHVPDFEGDILGLPSLIRHVIRPAANRPLYVIASGSAWLPAMAAFERKAPGAMLILSDPIEPPAPGPSPSSALKTQRASGQPAWIRPDAKAALPRRQKAAQAWAVANPDLRMGGASWGWFAARAKLRDQALSASGMAALQTPVLVLSQSAGVVPCPQLPRCVEQSVAGAVPYQQSDDADRQPWLEALLAGLAADHAP